MPSKDSLREDVPLLFKPAVTLEQLVFDWSLPSKKSTIDNVKQFAGICLRIPLNYINGNIVGSTNQTNALVQQSRSICSYAKQGVLASLLWQIGRGSSILYLTPENSLAADSIDTLAIIWSIAKITEGAFRFLYMQKTGRPLPHILAEAGHRGIVKPLKGWARLNPANSFRGYAHALSAFYQDLS